MDLKRWQSFSLGEQLLMIGSEIMRAKTWQNKDRQKFLSALERAFNLIDLSLANYKSKNSYMFLLLRQEIAKFYAGELNYNIEKLYHAF